MATREAELFKDKIEVTLDGRQIFYLFFGGAVIACLVFVLGVTVGRRVEARTNPPRAAAAVDDPLAALDELDGQASGELAFPAALRGEDDRPLGALDARMAQGAAAAGDRGKAGHKDGGRPAPAALAPASEKLAAAATDGSGSDDPLAAVGKAADDPAEAAAEPRAAAATEAPAPAVTKPAAAKPTAAKGAFTLQLSSFQDKAEAEAFLAGMKQAGYVPYLIESEVPGKGRWYRIRVGDYATMEAAMTAKTDFESKQKIIAYVTRL